MDKMDKISYQFQNNNNINYSTKRNFQILFKKKPVDPYGGGDCI